MTVACWRDQRTATRWSMARRANANKLAFVLISHNL